MYLEESVALINEKLKELYHKKNIVIWGAAENTVRLFQYTDILKYDIQEIVDNGKVGRCFFGKSVISPKDVSWDIAEAVVISSFYRENEIAQELKNNYHYEGLIIKLNLENQKKPFYSHLSLKEIQVEDEYRDLINRNRKFKDIHKGERLFIIGNGPSIKNMNLLKLRNEKKMVVSNFYLHKDYDVLKPDYYCFAQVTYTDTLNEQFYYRYFSEVGEKSGNPQFFFAISEKKIIDQCQCFDNKNVNYMYLSRIDKDFYSEIDITKKIMTGCSVPIDCIQLAIYMGFKEIYLVGIEHSELRTQKYNHFYESKSSLTGSSDPDLDEKGNVKSSFRKNLHAINELWNQYEMLKSIAESENIKIYNATAGGDLDIFERVDFNKVLG